MGFFLMEVEADLAYIWIQNPLSHSPLVSLFRAANASRFTWSERVFGRSSHIRGPSSRLPAGANGTWARTSLKIVFHWSVDWCGIQ